MAYAENPLDFQHRQELVKFSQMEIVKKTQMEIVTHSCIL